MKENITLARPYAKAAFAFAEQSKHVAQWANALAHLAAAIKVPEMANLLGNPRLNDEQVLETIMACVSHLNEEMKNFVTVLAHNQRLGLLPAISTLFDQYRAEAERVINVHITSAFPLEDKEREHFAAILGKNLQGKIEIESTTDANLIGGAIVRAGDKVIDGSVRGRLMQLTESLMNG